MTYKVEGKVETMEGYWNKGKLHGFAKAKYALGDTYTGFFRGMSYHGDMSTTIWINLKPPPLHPSYHM